MRVDSVDEVIDRIVLNVLVGNGDAHVKNWAFLYPDCRRPVLSPVYDVVPTVLYIPQDDLGLNLAHAKDFAGVTPESFDSLGMRSGYGADAARRRAQDAATKILDEWPTLRDYLRAEDYRRLTDRLTTLRLTKS